MDEANKAAGCATLSRRSFLKATGAVGAGALAAAGLGAFAETGIAEEGSVEELKYGICHGNCIGGCRFQYVVRDGVVAQNQMAPYPDERYNRICAKGLSHPQRTYSPDRIQYPMRRVAGSERGAGQWERITWDEAISEITTKWQEYIDEWGPACIGCSTPHNSGAQMGTYTSAIKNLLGFSNFGNQADQAGVYTVIQYLGIMPPMFVGNEAADIANAKNIFFFGCNGLISQLHCSAFIWEAKDKGAKVIAIDPNFTPTVARYADEFVPVRAATDACLFMGMMHAVIEEGLADEDFLLKSTCAPFLVKSDGTYLRQSDISGTIPAEGESDPVMVMEVDGTLAPADAAVTPVLTVTGKSKSFDVSTAYEKLLERLDQYPMDLCSEICGISEERIRELARTYADGPTTTIIHYGADHYTNGHTGYEALITLAALTGNLMKKGASITQGGNIAGFGLAGEAEWGARVGQADVATAAANGTVTGSLNITHMQLKEFFDRGTVNGQKVGEDGFTFKSWLIAGANPVGGAVNRKETIDVFNQLELVVVQDIVWTESADYADIVLPVAYYTEYEDVTNGVAFSVPYVNIQEKCIEPLAESKTDYEVFNLYARGLGRDEIVCESYDDWLAMSFAESAVAQKFGVTIDKLREEKTMRIMDGTPEDPFISMPATASGRVEFYTEAPMSNNSWPGDFDIEKERLVYWEPPAEAWSYSVGGFESSEAAKKYPLAFSWRRSRFATHTNYSVGNHWLDEIEPEPYVRLNPDDAAKRDISTGDLVRVFNDRGYCVIRARLDAGLCPGQIDSPQRWQGAQYYEGSMCDMSYSGSHPFISNANYNECMVEVERYEEV